LAAEPHRELIETARGPVSCLAWNPPGGKGAPVVWLHAAGFHGGSYKRFLAPLGDRIRVLAPDLRGHGTSPAPAFPKGLPDWSVYGDDVAAIVERLGTVVLAGHSLGAWAAAFAAARVPARVRGLLLVDPPVLPSLYRPLFALARRLGQPWRHPLARAALERRRDWDDPAEALAAWRGRGPVARFDEASLADHVAGALVPKPDGGWRLACAPEWEAATFLAQGFGLHRLVRDLQCPVIVIRGGASRALTEPAASRIARSAPLGRCVTAPGAGHFVPMERPEIIRAALLELAH
jgi:pimeloyl-ACP methyl ester carboxylesterase